MSDWKTSTASSRVDVYGCRKVGDLLCPQEFLGHGIDEARLHALRQFHLWQGLDRVLAPSLRTAPPLGNRSRPRRALRGRLGLAGFGEGGV